MKISGNLIDIILKKIYPATISIANQKILDISRNSNTYSTYIIPGFIDSHIHIESSMMTPVEFAKMQLTHGVIGCIADPHEIANVLGIEGILYMIEHSKNLPFYFNYVIPSCVPATPFETSGYSIGLNEFNKLINNPFIKGSGEVMNVPAVINNDPIIMQMIQETLNYGKVVDGHAPNLSGNDLKKYVTAGINTDHECTNIDEALEKIKLGMKILIREGSAAKDLVQLSPLLKNHSDMCMFCSDDKHPDDLIKWSINYHVNKALTEGYDLFNTLKVASQNPKNHYKLEHGLIQIGDNADFLIADNLKVENIIEVYIKGQLVVKNSKTMIKSNAPTILNNFSATPKSVDQFTVSANGNQVKVIEAFNGSLITKKQIKSLPQTNSLLLTDTSQDIVKIAVINRYCNAPPTVGFITGFGMKEGALASSVAHDSHNIVVIGIKDEDICEVVNMIFREKGGIALKNENYRTILPLPIAGLMSDKDGETVSLEYTTINKLASAMCPKLSAPFMTLSFMALLVIPELKIGDKGLFDVNKFEFTTLYEV